jgi:hypothetical protein
MNSRKRSISVKTVLMLLIFFGIVLAAYISFQKHLSPGKIYRSVQSAINTQTSRMADANIPKEYQGKLQLFILAGQSNMSGRGDMSQQEPETNSRIYVFGNDYHWKLASEPMDDPSNQVDIVSEDLEAGFGPSMSFAAAILEHRPEMIIGLIPCAKGVSSIYEWRRRLRTDTLYGSCLQRARVASNMGSIAGLLFFQGETDAMDVAQHPELVLHPDRWAKDFSAFIGDMRSDLNISYLPVVFAEIGTTTTPEKFPNWDIVQKQQRSVQLPFTTMITTSDLALKDEVHFANTSYQIIGKRFAEAYLSLLQK